MSEYNHTCANPNCPHKIVGVDGRPQPNYWACDDCDTGRGITWRRICCSEKCFNEYVDFANGKTKVEPEVKTEDVKKPTKATRKKTSTKTTTQTIDNSKEAEVVEDAKADDTTKE